MTTIKYGTNLQQLLQSTTPQHMRKILASFYGEDDDDDDTIPSLPPTDDMPSAPQPEN